MYACIFAQAFCQWGFFESFDSTETSSCLSTTKSGHCVLCFLLRHSLWWQRNKAETTRASQTRSKKSYRVGNIKYLTYKHQTKELHFLLKSIKWVQFCLSHNFQDCIFMYHSHVWTKRKGCHSWSVVSPQVLKTVFFSCWSAVRSDQQLKSQAAAIPYFLFLSRKVVEQLRNENQLYFQFGFLYESSVPVSKPVSGSTDPKSGKPCWSLCQRLLYKLILCPKAVQFSFNCDSLAFTLFPEMLHYGVLNISLSVKSQKNKIHVIPSDKHRTSAWVARFVWESMSPKTCPKPEIYPCQTINTAFNVQQYCYNCLLHCNVQNSNIKV